MTNSISYEINAKHFVLHFVNFYYNVSIHNHFLAATGCERCFGYIKESLQGNGDFRGIGGRGGREWRSRGLRM